MDEVEKQWHLNLDVLSLISLINDCHKLNLTFLNKIFQFDEILTFSFCFFQN